MPDRYDEELERLRSMEVADQWDEICRRATVGLVQPSEPGGRRARWPILVATAAILVLVAGVTTVLLRDDQDVTETEPTDTPGATPGAPPYFSSAPGWETVQTGSFATAGNGPLGPDAEDNFPAHETIGQLQEGDVLLQAAFYPIGDSTAVDAIFPPRELPLSLDDATPHVAFEGSPDVWADRLEARVDGWNIDVLVFYGGTDLTTVPPVGPTAEARTAAQEQLARLVVPASE